jgi:CSLREA domain-containing protein
MALMIHLPAHVHAFGRVAFAVLACLQAGSLALEADAAHASPLSHATAARSAHSRSAPQQTTTPNTWTVTSTADTNDLTCAETCTLRDAIYVAQPGDTIVFSSLFDTPQTIVLDNQLVITIDVTITGPGAGLLTLHWSGLGGTFAVVEVNDGTVAISGLTITNGLAGAGGAIGNFADLTISDVIFKGNNATQQGGAIYNSGTLHVDRSTFIGNASHFGAALFNTTSTGHVGVATLTNTTISGNTALFEGSSVASYGSPNNVGTALIHLQNCTLAGNKGGSPSVVAGDNNGPGSIDLINTIIAGNDGPSFGTVGVNASVISLGNNLSTDSGGGVLTASGDLINTNPLLSTLSNYGGTTPTLYPKQGSPAIDAGSGGAGAPATDQRGVTRPQGNAFDIGAVEADGELILQDGFDG